MTNPYEATRVVDDVGQRPKQKRVAGFVAWPLLLFLNVALPGFMAWPMCKDVGLYGVVLAVVAILVAGWTVLLLSPRRAAATSPGVFVLTVSQLFPVLQIFVGLMTCWLCESIGLMVRGPGRGMSLVLASELAGFVAVMIVAAQLLVATLLFAYFVETVRSRWT